MIIDMLKLKIKGVCFVAFLASYLLLAQQKQPNFLIILGDDISAMDVGCYGGKNPNVTPNIDKLSTEGIRFENMFVSEAMCAPTRAELYTGLMPYKNGCIINHGTTKSNVISVVQHLEKLGYRVGLTGKRHFKPRKVYPFEFVEGFTPNCTLNGNSEEDWSGVKEFVNRDQNQPFCLIICSVHAHSPWDAGNSDLWDKDRLILPNNMIDNETTRHFYQEYLAEIHLFDEQVGKARTLLKESNLEKNTALIVLDENGAGMPFRKWSTYDMGVRSACVMKWPEPYNSNRVTPALAQYCDVLPTLIDAAGGEVPDYLDGKSLLPVIQGDKKEHRKHAFFLFNSGTEGSEFNTRAVTDGHYKLIWNFTPDNQYAIRTINGFDYGYTDTKKKNRHVRQMYLSWLETAGYDTRANSLIQRYRKRPEIQLYDLTKDPEELNNLAELLEYQQKVVELKAEISEWMKDQNDKI